MSQVDREISGAEKPQDRDEKSPGEKSKLVDVSEAIRYRKRAQSAEKMQTQLEKELAEKKAEVERLNKNLESMMLERQLMEKLVAAGVRDLDAAVIIGRAKLQENNNTDVSEIVQQLKREKNYLFADGSAAQIRASAKTSGVKDRLSGATGVLGRVAKKAAESGSRTDLQEYLRARRNFV